MGNLDLFTAGIAASLAGRCGSCGSSSEPDAPQVGTAVVGQATLAGGSAPSGLPSGGTEGQVLAKKSNSDYDVEWKDAGSGGGALIVNIDIYSPEAWTTDKTAGEIYQAALNGQTVIFYADGVFLYPLDIVRVPEGAVSPDSYAVELYYRGYMTFTAASSEDYMTYEV